MKPCYVDSSAIVAMLLKEPDSQKFARLLEKRETWYSSSLLEAEVYATAAREKLPLETAKDFIEQVSIVIPERSLSEEYLRIFRSGICRGADACHIATALYLDSAAKHLAFITADDRQAKIAKTIGFHILPDER